MNHADHQCVFSVTRNIDGHRFAAILGQAIREMLILEMVVTGWGGSAAGARRVLKVKELDLFWMRNLGRIPHSHFGEALAPKIFAAC